MPSAQDLGAGVFATVVLGTIILACISFVWRQFAPLPYLHTVKPFELGVVARGNKTQRTIGPGSYWILPGQTLVVCDTRPAPFRVASQELVTSDGMGVRMSLAGEYHCSNPANFVRHSSSPFDACYLEARQALRIAVGELDSRSLLKSQVELSSRIRELLVPKATELGIEIDRVELDELAGTGWFQAANQGEPS